MVPLGRMDFEWKLGEQQNGAGFQVVRGIYGRADAVDIVIRAPFAVIQALDHRTKSLAQSRLRGTRRAPNPAAVQSGGWRTRPKGGVWLRSAYSQSPASHARPHCYHFRSKHKTEHLR